MDVVLCAFLPLFPLLLCPPPAVNADSVEIVRFVHRSIDITGATKRVRERGTETDVLAAAEQEDLGSRLLLFLTRDRSDGMSLQPVPIAATVLRTRDPKRFS